jgi:hypothetical protein
MNDKIISVQFKDDYMIIESVGRTHSIKRSDIGDGEWESLQAQLLQLSERGQKKKKYYSDHLDRL